MPIPNGEPGVDADPRPLAAHPYTANGRPPESAAYKRVASHLGTGRTQGSQDRRVWSAPDGATAAHVLAVNAGDPRLGPATDLCVHRGETMTLEEYRRETSCP